MSVLGNPDFEKELYFLVVKFLENGPCTNAAQVLRRELEDNKLVIPRKDWQGGTHERSIAEYNLLNNHVSPDHLVKIASSVNTLLQKCYPTSVKSINSLLPRGTFSVLRGEEPTTTDASHTTALLAVTQNSSARLIIPKIGKYSSIVPFLNGRLLSGVISNSNIVRNCNIYSKICMHKRLLGHLASVYCVLFDRTGSIIATGADDNLLKIWSASDGRLVATLRGHAGQITDIDINRENTLIAAGSLDKTIRVWKLTDTYPVAVLQGHTGMITSLKFCPYAHENIRFLMSTGGDGHVCFWSWDPHTTDFSLTPIKFNEKSRPGAQMLCSSFSPGGSFLVTGSSDNYIRVYMLYPDQPEKIAELPNHGDHVDSILYSHTGDRFLSGSRDGTAVIWYYRNGDWQAKCLDASKPLAGGNGDSTDKLKVTMICWNKNDHYVITAGTDCLLRVWNSHTATLVHPLKGHTDEVYGLEAHPNEPYLLLSAGHDGNIILWNIYNGERIKVFFNLLEGQGHGAIFDCKFSPHGDMFSATDSHGHLLIFGFGSNERYEKVPYEQFFHSDYRPIIRDTNNYVLDEQNQLAPHLMPPPFLVDIDGNPYESQYQLLIPGRNSSNLPHLRIEEPLTTGDMPPLMAEIAAAEAEQHQQTGPRNRNRNNQEGSGGEPFSPGGGGGVGLRETGDVEGVRQQNLYTSGDINDADAEAWRNRTIVHTNNTYNQKEDDLMRVRQGLDERHKYLKEKSKRIRRPSETEHVPIVGTRGRGGRGRGGRGRGRGGGRAKVRPNITYVRQEALQMLPYLQSAPGGQVVNLDGAVHQSSDSEPEDWQGESSDSTDDSDWVHTSSKPQPQQKESTRKRKQKRVPSMEYSFDEEDDDEDDEDISNRASTSKRRTKGIISDGEHEDVDVDGSDTSEDEAKGASDVEVEERDSPGDSDNNDDGDSTDDNNSDNSYDSKGSNDAGPSKKRKRRVRRKRRTATGKQKAEKKSPIIKKKVGRKPKKIIRSEIPVPPLNDLEAYLQFYQPPEWLLSVEPQKFPYFPQIFDEVYYFRQGHELYGMEVSRQNIYNFHEERQAYRRRDVDPVELCKLVGVTYDVGPPKILSLKLELVGKPDRSSGGKRTITIRFHDMPGVADFLVLKHIYDKSMEDCWEEGDRFRCIIDDSWYAGTIVEVSPYQETFLTSPFLSLVVKWDSGDDERLSPWDLEKLPQGQDITDNTPVSKKDKLLYQYTSTEEDWPDESKEKATKRVVKALRDISTVDIAAPFAIPVDVRNYPTYWSCIPIPTDLETIRKRLENNFYRRMESLLWEVRQLYHNTLKFNESGSGIVHDSKLVVKLLCKFAKDHNAKDIVKLYTDMDDKVVTEETTPRSSKRTRKGRRRRVRNGSDDDGDGNVDDNDEDSVDDETANGGDEEVNVVEEDEEEEIEEEEEEEEVEGESEEEEEESEEEEEEAPQGTRTWTDEAKSLVEFIMNKDDAAPFRRPVDLTEFPDYLEHVREPIDISIIRERMDGGQYGNADIFIRDFRSVFKNSKAYNTDRRSLIYKMTLRLSALFESRVDGVTKAYALSKENDVHLTRARTRNRRSGVNQEATTSSASASRMTNGVSSKHSSQTENNQSSDDDEVPSRSTSSQPVVKDTPITLDAYTKKPVTRSLRNTNSNNNNENGDVGCSSKTITTRTVTRTDYTESSGSAESGSESECSEKKSEKSEKSEKSGSSSEEEVEEVEEVEEEEEDNEEEGSDTEYKQPGGKNKVPNHQRMFKRCRYNNDSDSASRKRVKTGNNNDDDDNIRDFTNSNSPRKASTARTTTNNKTSTSRRGRGRNGKNTSTRNSIKNNDISSSSGTGRKRGRRRTTRGGANESVPRTSRSRNRTAVNYCEDDFDPFDILMEDERNQNHNHNIEGNNNNNNNNNGNDFNENNRFNNNNSNHDADGDSEDDDDESKSSGSEASNHDDDEDGGSNHGDGDSYKENGSGSDESESSDNNHDNKQDNNSSYESDSSASSKENVRNVASGVSSRGRVRKAASRFTDYVDK